MVGAWAMVLASVSEILMVKTVIPAAMVLLEKIAKHRLVCAMEMAEVCLMADANVLKGFLGPRAQIACRTCLVMLALSPVLTK